VAKHFKDLVAWQRGHELRTAVWAAVQRNADMDLRLRAQWTDAARSVCSNIAEGFGRRTHREFARFLDHATSSLKEVEDTIIEAQMRGHLSVEEAAELNQLVRHTQAPLAGLLRYLRRFPDRPDNWSKTKADNRAALHSYPNASIAPVRTLRTCAHECIQPQCVIA
jgi:four helix bundle protein